MNIRTYELLLKIQATVTDIQTKVGTIMSDQATEASIAAEIETDVAADNAATAAIQAEIASLQAANPGIDFTALNQAVTDANAATAAEQALVPPPAAPPAS